MKKKEPRWYILWFYTAGTWLITFCWNIFHNAASDFIIIVQFLNIILSLAAGIVNARRYKRKYCDEIDK